MAWLILWAPRRSAKPIFIYRWFIVWLMHIHRYKITLIAESQNDATHLLTKPQISIVWYSKIHTYVDNLICRRCKQVLQSILKRCQNIVITVSQSWKCFTSPLPYYVPMKHTYKQSSQPWHFTAMFSCSVGFPDIFVRRRYIMVDIEFVVFRSVADADQSDVGTLKTSLKLNMTTLTITPLNIIIFNIIHVPPPIANATNNIQSVCTTVILILYAFWLILIL